VTAAQAVLLELNWSRLGRALCGALKCDVRETDLGLSGAEQIGAFSTAAVPVVLSIQAERGEFRNVVAGVAARVGKPFILLAPTSRFVDAGCLGVLKAARAECFDLESVVLLMPSGKLQARKDPLVLFGVFLPDSSGPDPAEVARGVLAALEKLDSQGKFRRAPPSAVLRLYYGQGLSRKAVAKECSCVPGLITKRMKLIEGTLRMTRAALRGLSPHFQQIEDSLSDSRARRIDWKRSIYGDSPADEQEE